MKYEDIVEALEEELGWGEVRQVSSAQGGICDFCGPQHSIDVLVVTGSRGGGNRGPVRLKTRYLCADRPACTAREQMTRRKKEECVEDLFVPLAAPE